MNLFSAKRKEMEDGCIKKKERAKMSRLSTLAVLVVVLMSLIVQSQGTDPCVTHGNLNNPFRSTGYVAKAGVDPMICDNKLQTQRGRWKNA